MALPATCDPAANTNHNDIFRRVAMRAHGSLEQRTFVLTTATTRKHTRDRMCRKEERKSQRRRLRYDHEMELTWDRAPARAGADGKDAVCSGVFVKRVPSGLKTYYRDKLGVGWEMSCSLYEGRKGSWEDLVKTYNS